MPGFCAALAEELGIDAAAITLTGEVADSPLGDGCSMISTIIAGQDADFQDSLWDMEGKSVGGVPLQVIQVEE